MLTSLQDGELNRCLHIHVSIEGQGLVHSKHLHQLLVVYFIFNHSLVPDISRHNQVFVDSNPLGCLTTRQPFASRLVDVLLGCGPEGFTPIQKVGLLARVEVDARGVVLS